MDYLKDERSGVSAPVSVRVERAAGRQPAFILLGASEAKPGAGFESKVQDAKSLKMILHYNLPWPTYYALIREMLIGCTKGDVFYDRTMTPEIESSLRELIIALTGEIGTADQPVEAKPAPITKDEIRETLGWDKVPA